MDATRVAILGAIAGFTIFLGLPVARIRAVSARTRGFLSVVSAGILLFIFWDVLDAAHAILESSLTSAQHSGSWSAFAARLVMVLGGLAVGALGLAWLEGKVMHP